MARFRFTWEGWLGIALIVGAIALQFANPHPSSFIQIQANDIASAPARSDIPKWKVARALMRTIFTAEGTWHEGTKLNPYKIEVFTYNQIGDYSDHPHQYGSGSKLPCAWIGEKWTCSSAVGPAQWLTPTWNRVRSQKKFWFEGKSFSPQNQDIAMLYELQRVGSLDAIFKRLKILKGKPVIDRADFAQALHLAAPVWASLPTDESDDVGAYGQGARSLDTLWQRFQIELKREEQLWQG